MQRYGLSVRDFKENCICWENEKRNYGEFAGYN